MTMELLWWLDLDVYRLEFVGFPFYDALRATIKSALQLPLAGSSVTLKIHRGYVSISWRLDGYDAGMIFHYEGNVNIIVAC